MDTSLWAKGTGRYAGGAYHVDFEVKGVMLSLFYGVTVGRGDMSRRVGRTHAGKLRLPGLNVRGRQPLAEVIFVEGMQGYWQVHGAVDVLFAAELPEGATLYDDVANEQQPPTAPAALSDPRKDHVVANELSERVAGWLRCEASEERIEGDLGGGATVLAFWTEGPDGRPQYSAPDLAAPGDSFEYELAQLLTARPGLRNRLRAAANRGHGRTVVISPYVQDALRDNIFLGPKADRWMWTADGQDQEVCNYRKGDETVDLRAMIADGRAVPLAHNTYKGEPTELLGFLVREGLAFAGRNHDPFQLVVPAGVGESRNVHAVVRHQVGATVYGFTVANRSHEAAIKAAEREGVDPLDALHRRVVQHAGSEKQRYFVLPDGRVLYVPLV